MHVAEDPVEGVCLHSFKFTLVNMSHSQHSEAASCRLGRHFLICMHAHMKSRSQTKDHGHWSGSKTSTQAKSPAGSTHTTLGKALHSAAYKNSLLTALVNCKARMVSCQCDSFLCCSWSVVI